MLIQSGYIELKSPWHGSKLCKIGVGLACNNFCMFAFAFANQFLRGPFHVLLRPSNQSRGGTVSMAKWFTFTEMPWWNQWTQTSHDVPTMSPGPSLRTLP